MSFDLVAPPQLDANYANFLAFRHIQGLFSLLTSSNPTQALETRLLTYQHFAAFGIYNENDWGNSQLLELVNRSESLSCYANINTANGYFKAILKRDESDESGWFWALEWNKSYRIVGYISHPDVVPQMFKELPELDWCNVGKNVRKRLEMSLNPENDRLFRQEVVEKDM